LVSGGFSGCTTPPVSPEEVQLHTVSSESVASITTSPGEGVPVALRLSVSEYLDQPELVVREGEAGLRYSPRNQWAEPLTDGLVRLLRNRLTREPGISRVLPMGIESDRTPVLLVAVRVDRFEGETLAGGMNRAVIDASWRIVRPDDRRGPALSSGLFVREAESWDGKDYELLKNLLKQLAADLADTVAVSLAGSVETL
jgi:uncharacterized lipoprotein YmbA